MLLLGVSVGALVTGLAVAYALPPRGGTTVGGAATPSSTPTPSITPSPPPSPTRPLYAAYPWGVLPKEDPKEKWSYLSDEKGPAHWATLPDPSNAGQLLYPVCGSNSQSPIDLSSSGGTPVTLPLTREYSASNFSFSPRPGGHPGFQVSPNSTDTTYTWVVDGVPYNLTQFHYHSPSEHTIDGESFALEAHFVHMNAAGGLAVFGILYRLASDTQLPNPFFHSWWDNIYFSQVQTLPAAVPLSTMINDLDASMPYYRYMGSLTTPPCAEDVKWHVAVSATGVNVAELISFNWMTALIPNKRPVQQRNGRNVTAYTVASPPSSPL